MRMLKRIFSFDFLLTPFYVYKLIEIFVWKNQSDVIAITVRSFLTLIITPFVAITIVVLAFYFHFIELILKSWHGDSFYEMLDGCDRIWVLEFPSKNVINALYAIKTNGNSNQEQELLDFFREKYALITQTHPRFSSVIRSFMGLQYYFKIDIDLHKCVKFMDDYNNDEEFYKLLEKYCNKQLPMNNTYLWEFYIGKKTIDWYGQKTFPLFVRHHHSLGDGVSLVTLMTTHLLENGIDMMKQKCENYKRILKRSSSKGKIFDFLSKRFYYPTISDPELPNILHNCELSGDKHLIFIRETNHDDYVNKVKEIKNHYKVAFLDVINTAISASLFGHFSKYTKMPSKNIISMNPYFLMSPDFNQLVTIKNGVPITQLGNKFSMGFSKIPINLDVGSNNNEMEEVDNHNELMKRLQHVRDVNHTLKNSLDFAFCYWQMRMFAGVPLVIGKGLLLLNDATICITNVPGNTTSNLSNGSEVTDTFVFANNFGNLGVTITLFSYDERFRIGLLIDKSLIKNRKDAQFIGDNIFKYINLMYEHLPKTKTKSSL